MVPPEGGKPVPYRRASSYAKPLDDLNNVILWKQRLTAQGFVENKHLQLKYAAATEKRDQNAICKEAFLAAGGEKKADIGTALHSITEQLDRGEIVGFVPDEYVADVEAYQRKTEGMEWLAIERFVVQDDIKAAGTPDRVVRLNGTNYIFDLKTGSIGFPHAFSVQLAIYAHAKYYDPALPIREPLPHVDQDRAILCHLPAGEGVCTLHWLDIRSGWDEAVPLVPQLDRWRKTKNLTTPFEKAEVK